MSMSDPFGAGLGGPGMWDPMPLTPPVKPPSEPEQGRLIWSRPESEAPAEKRAAPRQPAVKKAAAPKAATRGRPVKKAAARPAKKPTGRPVKKAAARAGARKKRTVKRR